MDALMIIIPITAIIALIVFLMFRVRSTVNPNGNNTATNDNLVPVIFEPNGISIPIEQLPATIEIEDDRLFEITDSIVISRISQTFPVAAQTVANTVAKKIVEKTVSNPNLYSLKIPAGNSLVDKTKKGIQYAMHKGSDGSGFAQLQKADFSKMTKATSIANGVANVMNVGSLVVGQYYMTEINSKLEEMSKSIDKISDFQDREFKSRILALIARLGEISLFSSEILESDELRNRKLQTLDDLKGECTQLLQQINLTINEEMKKNPKPDYKEYQSKVEDFIILYEYQQMLLSVLEEISKLTYLLGKGEASSEMCYSIFKAYMKQSEQIRTGLEGWHDTQVESLGIDIDKNRKNRTGIEGLFASIPGIFDDKWNYKELKDGLGRKITAQKAGSQLMLAEPDEVYEKDVEIIIRDGKYFYLKGESHEHE